ncbi:MAG: PEGA domain-containing protein, partial [Deltaproteobacteria bacterium]|nr:PEGA domain-containing protein [Deltaproteobacteria bacterium]
VLLAGLTILFLGLGIGLVALLTSEIKAEQTETGFFVHSDPPNAEVYINGKKQFGKTPTGVAGLPKAEKYWIVVRKEGYQPFQRQLSLIEGKQLRVHAKLEAKAGESIGSAEIIISAPMGAQVYLDGTRRGVTPLRLPHVSANQEHVIVVRKKGFKEHTETLKALRPGQKLNLTFKLAAK